MRVLSSDECRMVAGGATCEYSDPNAMFTRAGQMGSAAAMAGYAVGGPTVAGIAGAGFAAATLAGYGAYNFVILISDLFGGCDGYTTAC